MKKKGMEMSINLIVIAALALFILIVLILIFTGNFGKFRWSLNKSQSTYSGDLCKTPGTMRQCRTETGCDLIGGINYGKLDCDLPVCCSE